MQNLLNFRLSSKRIGLKHSSTTNWNFQLCGVISVQVLKDPPSPNLGDGDFLYNYCMSMGMCGHYRYTSQLSLYEKAYISISNYNDSPSFQSSHYFNFSQNTSESESESE